jgi:hypothetical protein
MVFMIFVSYFVFLMKIFSFAGVALGCGSIYDIFNKANVKDLT